MIVDLRQTLPLETMVPLLNSKKLRSLQILQARLSLGHDAGIYDNEIDHGEVAERRRNDMVNVIRLSNVQELSLLHCRGAGGVGLLLAGLTQLKILKISNTAVNSTSESTRATLQALVQSPRLVSLKLRYVPALEKDHLTGMLQELQDSNGTTRLQELEVTSGCLEGPAGLAVSKMMLSNRTIQRLVLQVEWENCGRDIVSMLAINPTLTSLEVRLYGDDENVLEDALLIAKALRGKRVIAHGTSQKAYSKCPLRNLKLSVGLDLSEVDSFVVGSIVTSFDGALESNDTLRRLEVYNSLDFMSLPPSLKAKLLLNCCGASQLLHSKHQPSQAKFVKAMASPRNDLNTLYHILSNHPSLIIDAAKASKESSENAAPGLEGHAVDLPNKTLEVDGIAKQHDRHRSKQKKGSRFVRHRLIRVLAASA